MDPGYVHAKSAEANKVAAKAAAARMTAEAAKAEAAKARAVAGAAVARRKARTLSSCSSQDSDQFDRLFDILGETDDQRRSALRKELTRRECRVCAKDRITTGRTGERVFTNTWLHLNGHYFRSRKDISQLLATLL